METEKQFCIIILRPNVQEKSRQQELYGEKYKEFNDMSKYELWYTINKNRNEAQNVLEKCTISLKINAPTIQNLYNQINNVCPEITSRKQFYLYWRYSDSLLLRIFNYITYLTAIRMAAMKNNIFYLVLQGKYEKSLEYFEL